MYQLQRVVWIMNVDRRIRPHKFPVVGCFQQSWRPAGIRDGGALSLVRQAIAVMVGKKVGMAIAVVDQRRSRYLSRIIGQQSEQALPIGNDVGEDALLKIAAAVKTLAGNADYT